MTLSLALVLVSASLELDAAALVRSRFEQIGRSTPADDAQLTVAARALAAKALSSSAADAAGLLSVTDAISKAGGWDPSPTAVLIKAPRDQLLQELGRTGSLANEPTSAIGVGVVERDGRAALCVLLAVRKFQLEPVKRRFPRPSGSLPVCGHLSPSLDGAELFVTRPSGAVERRPMVVTGARACGAFAATTVGRHTVEVLGKGPRGPEVSALFFVDVGSAAAAVDQQIIEPSTVAGGRAAVVARINALRATMGLTPVRVDDTLEGVAQRWANRLASEGFFAHVDPQGGELKGRLSAAGYRFTAAGENLGASSGPLAAHFGIEHSPGHRLNLLEVAHRSVGVGIANRAEDGLTVLVEVLAAPLDDGGSDPLAAAYQAITELRARKGLPPMRRQAAFEALATEQVRRCLSRDTLSAEVSNGRRLHEAVFEAVPEVAQASVDLAIVDSPTLVPASKNLLDPGNRLVGIGLLRGDSARYGPDKLWLVVISGAAAE